MVRPLALLLVAAGALLLGSSIAIAGSGQFSESSAGGNSAAAAQYNPPGPEDDSDEINEGDEGQAGPDAPGAPGGLADPGSGGIPSASASASGDIVSSLPFTGLPLLPLGLAGLLMVLAGLALGRRDRAA